MTVFASFGANTLTVFGDNGRHTIELSRNAAGQLLVNSGTIAVSGDTPTVTNTRSIAVFGQGTRDDVIINEANGAMPRVNLFGGAANDVLTGGSDAVFLIGQAEHATLRSSAAPAACWA